MTAPASPPVAGVEPVSNPYKFDAEIAWLTEAARYFASRSTGGEDRAHWANVYNAENARKLAERLRALASPVRGDGSSLRDTHRSAEGGVLVLREPTAELYAEFANIDGPWCRGQMDCDDVWRALLDAQAEGTVREQAPPAASVSPGMETLQASECTKHGEGEQ